MGGAQVTADAGRVPRGFDQARAVADAVLYEGYLLYPYRRSSPKNRVRWQFGVLAPRRWIEARGPVADSVAGSAESWFQQTECLLEAPEAATVHVRLRFLQLQEKSVEARLTGGGFAPVERLEVDGQPHLSFEEAVPREFDLVADVAELLTAERAFPVAVSGGEASEPVTDAGGHTAGRVVRRRHPLSARVRLSVEPATAPFRLLRLRIRTENTGDVAADRPREEALGHALVAAHSLVALDTGSFVSLLDPPEWAAPAAAACTNLRTFPVLAGSVVISSPIILYDHPQVAPESPGDLFDATEIDEILSLRTLTLTDAEKREARATDPRAAAIVDRVDGMPPELMERLHGAVRSLRPTRPEPEEPSVVITGGVAVRRGARVRLRPRRRGTDAADMFLAGRVALVEKVLDDLDGARHVAVTVEDDPGAELHQWYGRFHYFSPEELEPLGDGEEVVR